MTRRSRDTSPYPYPEEGGKKQTTRPGPGGYVLLPSFFLSSSTGSTRTPTHCKKKYQRKNPQAEAAQPSRPLHPLKPTTCIIITSSTERGSPQRNKNKLSRATSRRVVLYSYAVPIVHAVPKPDHHASGFRSLEKSQPSLCFCFVVIDSAFVNDRVRKTLSWHGAFCPTGTLILSYAELVRSRPLTRNRFHFPSLTITPTSFFVLSYINATEDAPVHRLFRTKRM